MAMAPAEVIWEVTHACRARCRFCPWGGKPRSDDELTTEQGRALIAQLADWGERPPRLVLSGGDPLERDDILDLVSFAAARRVPTAVELAATPRLVPRALEDLRRAGSSFVRIGLDGPSASTHEELRGARGSFLQTLHACWTARSIGLPFRIATTVWPRNLRLLPALARLVVDLEASGWDLFFFVPRRRSVKHLMLRPTQAAMLAAWIPSVPVETAVFEAPWGTLDALTVTPQGFICPGRFLPMPVGHVYRDSLLRVWESDPVRRLRQPALRGSRARAYADTGDAAAADPLASDLPGRSKRRRAAGA